MSLKTMKIAEQESKIEQKKLLAEEKLREKQAKKALKGKKEI
jgi:hypothetical protein